MLYWSGNQFLHFLDILPNQVHHRWLVLLNLTQILFVIPLWGVYCQNGITKRHNGLESPTVYVLVTDNKFDFYNITEIADKKYRILDWALKRIIVKRVFTIHQLAHFLIIDLEKDLKKYKSKLVVITGDFFLSDSQITKQDKDWLYPQMIQAIKKVKDSIILVFSPTGLSNLMNYG